MVDSPPEGEKWIHETKFDGYRIQAHVEKNYSILYSRRGLNWTTKFPTIAQALNDLPAKTAIIDGEVVWLDDDGRSDFQKLQNSLKAKDSSRLIYYAFDLLFLNGEDCRELPLIDRKHLLAKVIKSLDNPIIRYCDHIEGNAKAFFEAACDYQLEGIVSKNQDSIYQSRRTSSWMKAKCKKEQEFVIGGYTAGEGARTGFGALLLGAYEGNQLRYVGKSGTGFTEQSIAEVKKKLEKIEQSNSPFDINSPKEKKVHWVNPVLVAEITFGNWTSDGILRTAVFHGIREDKAAEEVRIEKEKPTEVLVKKTSEHKKKTTLSENSSLPISNPEKIFYKEEGITKLQVAKYYQDFSEFILPHVENRPLNLYRCPDGTKQECFFQKHAPDPIPENLNPVKIRESKNIKTFLTIDSSEGLLALSQMGAFEIHVWGCNVNRVDNPDQIVMDFDPGPGATFKDVISGAKELKTILDDLDLKSYVKLTGGKGLHVHIPVAPIYSWDQIKNFAKTLGVEMVHRKGDRYTVSLAKKAREGKIFIDYLRNGRGATAVIPYSLRAKHVSSIAMPVSWDDLDKIKASNQFTLDKAYQFLEKRRKDPWADYYKSKQRIAILDSIAV